jgi:hypothetical protein
MNNHDFHPCLTREFFTAEIQRVISRIPFLSQSVNSFLLYFNEENFSRKGLRYCFELRETASFIELSLIQAELSKQVLKELEILNRQFFEIVKKLKDTGVPLINFYSLGEGPFKAPGGHTRTKIAPKLNY